LVILLFKLISAAANKFAARLVFLLILIAFTATAFNEGKKGGELVYKYGANVKTATAIQASGKADQVVKKIENKMEEAKTKAKSAIETVSEKTTEVVGDIKQQTSDVANKAQDATGEATQEVKKKADELEKSTEKTAEPDTALTPEKNTTSAQTVPAD
jgi:uncharacterized protein YjbJ (UPF0337 family)